MNGASGSNNNNNKNNNYDSTIERKKAERLIQFDFLRALTRKAKSLSNLKFDDNELRPLKQIFYDETRAFILVGAFGILNFVLLRALTRYNRTLKVMAKSRNSVPSGNGGGGRTSRTYNSPFAQQGSNTFSSSNLRGLSKSEFLKIDHEINQPGFPFRYLFDLSVDTTIALLCTGIVASKLTNVDRVSMEVAQFPLTDKKSVICDEFCPVMMQELEKVRRELSDPHRTEAQKEIIADCLNKPQSRLLKTFLHMAKNCSNRALRENPDNFVSPADQLAKDSSDNGSSNDDDDHTKK